VYLFDKLKEMKTLLIDDDEWIRDSMSLFFAGEGCNLLAVETAEEGMEKLKRQDYDVIIVDYRLPGMDGLEFLNRIRDSHPNALTLLITAYGSREVFSKASNLGVQGFIDKPFTVKTLEDALARLIEKNEK
jgi:DNA-binding NtrC family response regulator